MTPDQRVAAPTAAELDRQIRRLYQLAYRIAPIADLLTNPRATGDAVAHATTRIPRALSAARRLLALPGVADHDETPYAMSRLQRAERLLNAPATPLLTLANTAQAAADQADAADDDLRVVIFRDIEQTCRRLIDSAYTVVRGVQGWTGDEHALSQALQRQAEQWGLTSHTGEPRTAPTGPGHPPVSAYYAQQAAHRAAVRARCADGIRCTRTSCLTYGAVWVEHPAGRRFLCTACIPAENADLAARGFASTVRPVPGKVPADALYFVTLHNAIGPARTVFPCRTPQRAQFIAETERPYNNTHPVIQLTHPN